MNSYEGEFIKYQGVESRLSLQIITLIFEVINELYRTGDINYEIYQEYVNKFIMYSGVESRPPIKIITLIFDVINEAYDTGDINDEIYQEYVNKFIRNKIDGMNKIKSCKKNEKGYEINPITGKKRKSCLPHQVRNPITGKKRKSCLPHQVEIQKPEDA